MEQSLAEDAGRLLKAGDYRLVTAESCTGGLLGHMITEAAGSSAYYLGGYVVYANASKERFLEVPAQTLEAHGAVSRETVLAMAAGARRAYDGIADPGRIIAVSISGIAGPDGGTPEKPIGTVWIGIAGEMGERAERYLFAGGRTAIKMQSAEMALRLLADYLASRA